MTSIPDWAWHGITLPVHLDALGEGRPVLLLPAPSSICSRREMAPLQRRLAATCRTVAVDWPSFGEAGRPAVIWTPDALSKFLTYVLHQAVGIPAAVIAAGHAATYALHHAAAHPGEISRLVLIAPTWRGPLRTMAGGDRRLFRRLRRAVEAPLIGPLLFRANMSRFMLRRMAGGHVYSDPAFMTPDWLNEKSRVTGAHGARFGTAAFVTGGLDRVDSREAFLDLARRASVPITLIYGAETPPKSRAEMEALAELPGVQAHLLPRGKLALHEEFPDAAYAALPDFA